MPDVELSLRPTFKSEMSSAGYLESACANEISRILDVAAVVCHLMNCISITHTIFRWLLAASSIIGHQLGQAAFPAWR